MVKDKTEWVDWNTRIPKEKSDRLLYLGQLLVRGGSIEKADRYSITRWCLMNSLNSLEEIYQKRIRDRQRQVQANTS